MKISCRSGEDSQLCPDPDSLRRAAAFSFRPHQHELPQAPTQLSVHGQAASDWRRQGIASHVFTFLFWANLLGLVCSRTAAHGAYHPDMYRQKKEIITVRLIPGCPIERLCRSLELPHCFPWTYRILHRGRRKRHGNVKCFSVTQPPSLLVLMAARCQSATCQMAIGFARWQNWHV